jgi:hypothetical protein
MLRQRHFRRPNRLLGTNTFRMLGDVSLTAFPTLDSDYGRPPRKPRTNYEKSARSSNDSGDMSNKLGTATSETKSRRRAASEISAACITLGLCSDKADGGSAVAIISLRGSRSPPPNNGKKHSRYPGPPEA